ncbi:hypothetical protein GCM10027098_04730 [Bowmanella dokdonensis]
MLDGSGSMDADGDSLSFNWVLDAVPPGSEARLSNQTSVSPVFTADLAGEYQISLVVNDGELDSTQDNVQVSASLFDVDITDIQFVSRSGNCADYVGTYFSNVMDIQRTEIFKGEVAISLAGAHCVFTVNAIPNHDFNDESADFAHAVSVQQGVYLVPVSPARAGSGTALSLDTTNVIFLNGVSADLLAAACYDIGNETPGQEKIGCGQDQIDNPWRYDPMSSLNTFGTDSHNAHPQPDGTYHYHGDPRALFDLDCEANANESPVIGFAADGFPVYGPCFNDGGTIRAARSSYVLKDSGGLRQPVSGYSTPGAGVGLIASDNYDGQFRGDYEYQVGKGDLDQCNGMTVEGQYGYYLTGGYPWILGCFSGTPDESFHKTGPALKNLLHDHSQLHQFSRPHSH